MDKFFENRKGDTKQRDRTIAIRPSLGFEGFGIATAEAFLQTLGILRWCEQKKRKPCARNQDIKAAPDIYNQVPQLYPAVVFGRAAANSAAVKSPKILTGVAVGVLQRS